MKAISLFSGAGGFEIGFDRAGIRTILQAESDPWCLEVLARHWPDCERVTDVRSVRGDGSRLVDGGVTVLESPRGRRPIEFSDPRALGTPSRVRDGGRHGTRSPIDLVYGGWPCQGNSVAGKRAGLGDERSGLWSEVRRVLSELRPRWFVGENVPGLFSVNRGLDFCRVLMDLDELGYGVAWATLDARWFGVPQRRRRVFVVGCLGNAAAAAQVLAVCESCGGHPAASREARQGASAGTDERVTGSLGAHHGNIRADQAWTGQLVASEPEARALTARASGYRMDGETENFVVAGAQSASDGHHGHSSPRGDGSDNLIAFDWQASSGGTDESFRGQSRKYIVRSGDYAGVSATRHDAISNNAGVRRLTPLECERLMGWGDDHTRWTSDDREIPDSHRYRLCGNGVVSTCAEWIGHRLIRVDEAIEALGSDAPFLYGEFG